MRIIKVHGDIKSYEYDNGDIVPFDEVGNYLSVDKLHKQEKPTKKTRKRKKVKQDG